MIPSETAKTFYPEDTQTQHTHTQTFTLPSLQTRHKTVRVCVWKYKNYQIKQSKTAI